MSEETQETTHTASTSRETQAAKSETITIKKDALWKYSTVILGVALILVIAFGVLPGKSTTGAVIGAPPTQVPPAQAGSLVTIDLGDSPLKGSSDAKVAMLEWSDYECPFCARFYSDSLPAIESLVKSGEMQFRYRDFPLNFHPQAQKAAEAARCARDQEGDDIYYEMHDLLFEQGVQGGVESFKSYAGKLGLNQAEFDSCLDSGKFASDVQKDMQEGTNAGIRGTPGFILGTVKGDKVEGRLISGACPGKVFTQAHEAEKAGKKWTVTNCQFTEF
jgi:protein-disulfide isomerase